MRNIFGSRCSHACFRRSDPGLPPIRSPEDPFFFVDAESESDARHLGVEHCLSWQRPDTEVIDPRVTNGIEFVDSIVCVGAVQEVNDDFIGHPWRY